jgi:hypothetical protein
MSELKFYAGTRGSVLTERIRARSQYINRYSPAYEPIQLAEQSGAVNENTALPWFIAFVDASNHLRVVNGYYTATVFERFEVRDSGDVSPWVVIAKSLAGTWMVTTKDGVVELTSPCAFFHREDDPRIKGSGIPARVPVPIGRGILMAWTKGTTINWVHLDSCETAESGTATIDLGDKKTVRLFRQRKKRAQWCYELFLGDGARPKVTKAVTPFLFLNAKLLS